MNEKTPEKSSWKARNTKNTLNLFYWTSAWLLTTALASFGSKLLWNYETSFSIVAIVLNLAAGFGMIYANKRVLNGLDELMKKIQLEAMAVSIGVGLVVGLSYEQLEDIKLIASEPEISHLVILMALTYLAAVILGIRRYR